MMRMAGLERGALLLGLAAALGTSGTARATTCFPACECPVSALGEGGRDRALFPGDGATVPTNARLFVARPTLDAAAISLVETATDAPVAFTVEPTEWSASHVWIVPDEPLRDGTQHTLRVGPEPDDVSTFVVEGVDTLAPRQVQLTTDAGTVPCNEAVYAALRGSASDGASDDMLFHFTVEGGGLAAPVHLYRRTATSFGEVRLVLGRALDDEGCFEETFSEAEDGAEYSVRLEVYDPAGQLGDGLPTLRVTTVHKETSAPEDATCEAGCCVLSVGGGGRSDAGAALVTLLALAGCRWRRRSRAASLRGGRARRRPR